MYITNSTAVEETFESKKETQLVIFISSFHLRSPLVFLMSHKCPLKDKAQG